MPASHREARDFVASLAGLEPLSGTGGGGDADERPEGDEAFAALTTLSDWMHDRLIERPEVVEWCAKQWGFDLEAIKRHRVGFAVADGQWRALIDAGFSDRVAASTGAFQFSRHDDAPIPFFKGRVVFPYFAGGRCVYLIGRKTPWCEATPFEAAKYKKLPVHSETRPYVSPAIDNRALFGEGILATRPDRLIVTEGVTDAIAAQGAGFPCVSPVTVRIAREDMRRVVDGVRAAGTKTVYLVEDIELSGIGEAAALETARALEEHGVRCLVATLPLGESETKARDEFVALVGQAAHDRIRRTEPARRKKEIEAALRGDESAIAKAFALMEAAKVDLCSFLRDRGADGLEVALAAAREPVEVAIDAISPAPGAGMAEKVRSIEPVLREISKARPAVRDEAIRRLADKIGVPVAVLKSETSEAGKRARRDERTVATAPVGGLEDGDERAAPGGGPATGEDCKDIVRNEVESAAASRSQPNWGAIAEIVYGWLVRNGGRAFRGPAGDPLLLWRDELFAMRSDAPGARARYEGLMWRLTGTSPTTSGERRMYAVLGALAADRGKPYQPFGWIRTDAASATVHVAADSRRILRLSAAGVEPEPNGETVFLRASPKHVPFAYEAGDGDGDPWLDAELDTLIASRLACARDQARALVDWLCCHPLLELSGTRPAVRLSGDPASGKSWAAKVMTALLFGEETQKRATSAANWADSSSSPLVALDNVETEDADHDLIRFLLTAVTGISREKRTAGTESGITIERPACLVMTTGVEPLGGELQEVVSRSIIVRFDREMQSVDLLERPAIEAVKAARPRILSAIYRRAARVLAMIRDEDAHARAIRAVRAKLGDHDRRRCDEYLALMWLWRVAGSAGVATPDEVSDEFAATIEAVNAAARDTTRDSSPITLGMVALFGILSRDDNFRGACDLKFKAPIGPGAMSIEGARTDELFVALSSVARSRSLAWPYRTSTQFGVRFAMAIPFLEERGFSVSHVRDRSKSKVWSISYQRTEIEPGVGTSNGSARLAGSNGTPHDSLFDVRF
jgi:DNA primase